MSAFPVYDQGGSGSPLGTVDCPNNQATPIIGPNQERIMLAVCAALGETVILQPLNTKNPKAGFCLRNGETKWLWWQKQSALTALGWQIYNNSGATVTVTVAEVIMDGWSYPTKYFGPKQEPIGVQTQR